MTAIGPLSRSADGLTIHHHECRFARQPWTWANDKNEHQIRAVTEAFGYALCKFCDPLTGPR